MYFLVNVQVFIVAVKNFELALKKFATAIALNKLVRNRCAIRLGPLASTWECQLRASFA